ncbi:hypothetical protein AVEN_122452-1 [Araneus ventricosus]|uniref:Uncharacterized protein n=1 Tax=Araneus ventricosus TaxID=182803 RepID=A0A4Y2FKR7_ARAVE|nr:hypothetical protein AVEN_122452-1 [Araneus ventricosus]
MSQLPIGLALRCENMFQSSTVTTDSQRPALTHVSRLRRRYSTATCPIGFVILYQMSLIRHQFALAAVRRSLCIFSRTRRVLNACAETATGSR